MRFSVQVKNNPCVRYTSNMCLISWIRPCGSETGPMYTVGVQQ